MGSPRASGNPASALRQSPSTSSEGYSRISNSPHVPATIDEEELLGDEEMMDYIRRHHTRKLASGSKKEDLDEMLKFPEPIQPAVPLTPQGRFNSRF